MPSLPAGFIPTAVVEGDFNGDGKMDIAISNGGDNTIYILLGNGDGTFAVPEILYTQGQAPDWITAVSLRNNGHLDLAVTDGDSNTVEIFLGNGDGTFQPGVQVSVPTTPTFLLAGDFNNDGKPDLVVGLTIEPATTQPQFEILLGDGAGGFSGVLTPPAIPGDPLDPIPTGWIAAADLNKDGFIDLVTTVTGCCGIAYINQGGMSFSNGPSFAPIDGAAVVGLGDMDEDGCPDAVELGGFGLVTIAKGTCDGNFTQGSPVAATGDIDPAVKIVDINGDGHLDVVASSVYFALGDPSTGAEAGYLVSVLHGDGKGNLTMGRTYRAGSDAFSLDIGDFNGDGHPDVVTADSAEDRATLLLNDGAGGFQAPQGEAIGYTQGVTNAPNPTAPMEVADLNGDGKADLILVEDGPQSTVPSQLTTMLNDGTGKFLAPVRTPITVGPNVVFPRFAVGAFRNPAKPDVVYISRFTNPGIVAFFAGNGDGSFVPPVQLATLPNPLEVVSGDFNGDGKLDFVVYGTDGLAMPQQQFDVFLGHGDGTFTQLPSQKFPITNGGGIQQLIAVDLNHDGKLDLLIGNNDNGGLTTNNDLIQALGNGDGTFQTPTTLIAQFGPVAVADVNHDGLPDLIQGRDPNINSTTVFTTPAVTIYLGTAGGAFQKLVTYDLPGLSVPTFAPLLVGDFNGDGNIDVAVPYFTTNFSKLRVLQGRGDGTFVVTGDEFQLQELSKPFVGADFNGDGTTDLVELVGFTASFHTIPAAAAPSLAIAIDSGPIIGTQGGAKITLDQPAPTATDVALTASDPAVQLPSTLHFNTGDQTQNFSFTLGPAFDGTHVLALAATLGAETVVAYVAKPNPNLTVGVGTLLSSVPGIALTNVSLAPGQNLNLTLELGSFGGYTGTFGSFACQGLPAGAACSFGNSSVILPPGAVVENSVTITTSAASPLGVYPLAVTTTDGFLPVAANLQLGLGDFALSLNPALLVLGPAANTSSLGISSTSSNGLNETIALACAGFPAPVTCDTSSSQLVANGGSTGIHVFYTHLAAGDYPFQITGAIGVDSHSVNGILRVGDFSASLDQSAATLSPGQSAKFNVSLTSINHYVATVTVFCQPASQALTCNVSPAPASLGDDGTATVQLTITRKATGSVLRSTTWAQSTIWLGILTLGLLLIRRSKKLLTVAFSIFLIDLLSCGGGGTASTPTPTPTPAPASTAVVSVIAQVPSDQNNSVNQKTLPQIVITLN